MLPIAQPRPACGTLLLLLMLLIGSQERKPRQVQGSSDSAAGGHQGCSQGLKLANLIRPITETQYNQVFSPQGHWDPHWPSCCFWNTPDLIPLPSLCTGPCLHQVTQGSPPPAFKPLSNATLTGTAPTTATPVNCGHLHSHTHQNALYLLFSSSNILLHNLFNKNVSLMSRTFSSLTFLRLFNQCLNHKYIKILNRYFLKNE